jgi:hypothetical protein
MNAVGVRGQGECARGEQDKNCEGDHIETSC